MHKQTRRLIMWAEHADRWEPIGTITSLQIENVKRVKALRLEPSPQGLTVIGGKNGQGKTSVLDAIAAALGGAKKLPSNLPKGTTTVQVDASAYTEETERTKNENHITANRKR